MAGKIRNMIDRFAPAISPSAVATRDSGGIILFGSDPHLIHRPTCEVNLGKQNRRAGAIRSTEARYGREPRGTETAAYRNWDRVQFTLNGVPKPPSGTRARDDGEMRGGCGEAQDPGNRGQFGHVSPDDHPLCSMVRRLPKLATVTVTMDLVASPLAEVPCHSRWRVASLHIRTVIPNHQEEIDGKTTAQFLVKRMKTSTQKEVQQLGKTEGKLTRFWRATENEPTGAEK
ncbi:hypothetical protein C8R44DRAFT_744469 [Mycena epipterygia]|nr:hypothetical protein C8R44DRAFT_744469 [Mycena epipterygia]